MMINILLPCFNNSFIDFALFYVKKIFAGRLRKMYITRKQCKHICRNYSSIHTQFFGVFFTKSGVATGVSVSYKRN